MAPVPTLFEPVVLYDLKRHAREFRCVSLSGDGLFCAAVGGDEVVWFDVVDNRILWTTTVASEPDQPADVVSCAVSADGSAIVVGVSDGRVLVLDAVSGAVTTRQTHRACASNSRVAAVACSALCYCSAGVDGAVVVFRFGAGDSVATSYVVLETAHSARRNHEGHDDSVALELANFGEECLSANFRDMVSERHVAPVPAALFCCAISANSIAAGGEGETVSVWETCDGAWEKAEVFDLEGHETTVLALAWAPGNTLASLDAGGQVRLWQSKNCAAVFGFAGRRGCCLGFSKCGNWLAAGAQQGLKVWDVAQEGPPKLVLFAHDDVGLRAASVVWPLPTSKAFTAVAAGVDRKRLIWRAPECCLDGDSAVARLTLHEEVDRFQARFSGGETADASIDLATIDRQDMAARLWRATPDESVPVLRCAAFVSAADCLGARSAAVSFGTAFACRPARHRGAVLAIADDEASVRAFHVQPAAPDDKAASTSGVFSGGFDVEQLASAPSRVPVRSVGFGWGRTVMISDVLGTVNFVDAATGFRRLAFDASGCGAEGEWAFVSLSSAAGDAEPKIWCCINFAAERIIAWNPNSKEVVTLATLPSVMTQIRVCAVNEQHIHVVCLLDSGDVVIWRPGQRLFDVGNAAAASTPQRPVFIGIAAQAVEDGHVAVCWSATDAFVLRRCGDGYDVWGKVQLGSAAAVRDAAVRGGWLYLATATAWLHMIRLPALLALPSSLATDSDLRPAM